MQLTPSKSTSKSSSPLLLGAILATAAMLSTTEAFLPSPSFAVKTVCVRTTDLSMALSDNSKRTGDRGRQSRGGPQDYGGSFGGGQDHDYSGGNLKYGTGKFTQRQNEGYGVNLSKNGRSMQDSVYREDRNNAERTRGLARGDNFGGSRMDELEDLERGMGGGRPMEGMRDRMMRNRSGGGGSMMMQGDDRDMHDMDDFGQGVRDRMGGGGLLRDLQNAGGRNRESYGGYEEFGSAPKVMGGSSKGRGGGYRSSQFENGLANERGRFEEYGGRMGGRMDEYLDDRDGIIDYESSGTRRRMEGGGGGRPSNFDMVMGRGGGGGGRDRYDEYEEDRYEMERGGRGRRGERERYDDFEGGEYGDDYGEEGGRGGGGGGLLRDMRRP